jgi:hypothetical protein
VIEPGSTIDLTYPDSTIVDRIATLRRRRIQVVRLRDLIAEPLTPAEFMRRPLIHRSRWLITGFDLDSGKFRQFYLGSSTEYRSPGNLCVALYEPDSTRPSYRIARPFGPSRAERITLAKALAVWTQLDLDDLQLRIIADDLSIRFAG